MEWGISFLWFSPRCNLSISPFSGGDFLTIVNGAGAEDGGLLSRSSLRRTITNTRTTRGIIMFELEGESPEQRRERLRRQRKEFLDFIYRDLENLRRQR